MPEETKNKIISVVKGSAEPIESLLYKLDKEDLIRLAREFFYAGLDVAEKKYKEKIVENITEYWD